MALFELWQTTECIQPPSVVGLNSHSSVNFLIFVIAPQPISPPPHPFAGRNSSKHDNASK